MFGGEPLDTRTPAPLLPVTSTTRRTKNFTFPTPAKGDAYDFTLEVDLCLCATGTLRDEALDTKIDARFADLRTVTRNAARWKAREFPPFRPGAAEPAITAVVQAAVDRALTDSPDEDGVVFDCSATVRVQMDSAIRELQRRSVAEQVQFEARYELSEQAAQRLGELREVWTAFIAAGLPRWETPYAVLMAQQPAQTATTLFKMREDRQEEARGLVDTVVQVASGHERMDLLEFALASDSALSKTYELLGIAEPEPGPQSRFDEPEEANGS
ncbi:hypothetical protein [Sphaerisporangium rhizosphaerae]|uniref:Uncharacterized protein n=1 Tax=Sphaerisporangium rhizosphaerae TaxID=2269375 RepID=A0ABW2P0M7_9ACTN